MPRSSYPVSCGAAGALVALALLVPLLLWLVIACAIVAPAHDAEQWIADQHLEDPVTGAYCCGPSDCAPVAPGDIRESRGGYTVVKHAVDPATGLRATGDAEFVPYERVLPLAPDGQAHRCLRYGNPGTTIRCLIVPPPGE
jgi:hypothetical protein